MKPRLPTLMAMLLATSAYAQPQPNSLQPPPLIAPIPQPTSPLSSRPTHAGNDAAKLGRDLDAASRRVQADGVRHDIDRGDQQLQTERARLERERGAHPARGNELRQEYDQKQADHDAWRVGKERELDRIETEPVPEPPPPNDVPPVTPRVRVP